MGAGASVSPRGSRSPEQMDAKAAAPSGGVPGLVEAYMQDRVRSHASKASATGNINKSTSSSGAGQMKASSLALELPRDLDPASSSSAKQDRFSFTAEQDSKSPLRQSPFKGTFHSSSNDSTTSSTNSPHQTLTSSGKRAQLQSMHSLKSLKSMALRSYSRQENTYIPHESILSASQTHIRSAKLAAVGSNGSISVSSGSKPGSTHGSFSNAGSFRKTPTSSVVNMTQPDGAVPPPPSSSSSSSNNNANVVIPLGQKKGMGGLLNKPNLRINIQDDVDWIQVSDDEEEDNTHKTPRKTLTLLPQNAQQSYLLTQSGTIFVDGFGGGIGKHGINAASSAGSDASTTSPSPLALHDRIVFMAKLGAGASGVVYKALDLWEMRLAAVKMIPMFDRAKRRQCVKEVSILFSILRGKNDAAANDAASKATAKLGHLQAEAETEQQAMPSPSTDPGPASSSPASSSRTSITSNLHASLPSPSATATQCLHAKRPHEYIVDFYDAFSNIDDGGVAIMMEYMDGGSLQDIVNDGGCDDEWTLASIAQQGLRGLAFLHDCAQLHRDLKPGNFLISKRGECKIADLGILRQMDPPPGITLSPLSPMARAGAITAAAAAAAASGLEGQSAASASAAASASDPSTHGAHALEAIPRAQTFVGTATYMSPERIDGQTYSYPSDIWSFGLSLLTVALGRLPIDTQGGYWTILHSIRDDAPPAVPCDGRFSDDFRDFVAKMLVRRPEERLTARRLLEHPFLLRAREGEAGGQKGWQGLDADVNGEAEEGEEGEEDREADEALILGEIGARELRAVVSALMQHLERRRGEQRKAAKSEARSDDQSMPQRNQEREIAAASDVASDGAATTSAQGQGRGHSLAFVLSNLTKFSQAEALESIFFGETGSRSGDAVEEASGASSSASLRTRLLSLSVQLGLSLDRLMSDLRELIDEARVAEATGRSMASSQAYISTPKAAHGKGRRH